LKKGDITTRTYITFSSKQKQPEEDMEKALEKEGISVQRVKGHPNILKITRK
jgi:2-C-methyl-D-erythritol 4-phosphate cytidylyltransferase